MRIRSFEATSTSWRVFPSCWRVPGQLLDGQLHVEIEPDFDPFRNGVPGFPAREGGRLAAGKGDGEILVWVPDHVPNKHEPREIRQ